MREILSEVNPKTGRTELEQLLRQLLRRAHQGSMKSADAVLERAFGKAVAVQQNLNINANMSDESQMSAKEIHALVEKKHQEMGIPPTVISVQGHREVDREAVRARVKELLEKMRVKALPAPQMAPGSEQIQ